jgi:hypothetical protein
MDGHSGVRGLIDASGSLTDSYAYVAFGDLKTAPAPPPTLTATPVSNLITKQGCTASALGIIILTRADSLVGIHGVLILLIRLN